MTISEEDRQKAIYEQVKRDHIYSVFEQGSKDNGIVPKANCRKCYGRGYKGINIVNMKIIPCDCIAKQLLDKGVIKKNPPKLKLGKKVEG